MDKEKITIFHTNDLHSRFEQYAKIAAVIKEEKGPNDLYLDGGDMCDLSSPIVLGTKGTGAMAIAKAAGVDAVAIGNNEIDLEYEGLEESTKAGVPMISCNLSDNNKNPIGEIKKSIIFEKAGCRILVIGVSPYLNMKLQPNGYNEFSMMSNIMTSDPIEAIKKELQRQKGTYDYCILLSHSGVTVEEFLMEQIPEIDLCIGGHSHTLCMENKYSQAGMFGSHLGKIVLEVEDGKVKKVDTYLYAMTKEGIEYNERRPGTKIEPQTCEIQKDKEVLQEIQNQEDKANKILDAPLFQTRPLEWDVEKESTMTNFIADALYKEYPCDFAFINAGIVSGGIEGKVSKKRLLELSPSKLNPTKFPVKGENLLKIVEHSLDPQFVRRDGKGPGVRGNVLGTLGFSHNVSIEKNPLKVMINGRAVEKEDIYSCVADDALQRGTGYEEIRVPNSESHFYDGFIRDLMERCLLDEELHKTAKIKRLKI